MWDAFFVQSNSNSGMKFQLSYDFSIKTELLHFYFRPGNNKNAFLRQNNEEMVVVMPKDFDFSTAQAQTWANLILENALRQRAQQVLPSRLDNFAQEYNLRYHRVYIKNVRTRWGSCSSLGNINLSLWLMLAPLHLVDYVIKHELAHLNEMNHSQRFWAEVDRMTGGPGSSKRLEKEMKAFAQHLQKQFSRIR